jgi:hypothetical protein
LHSTQVAGSVRRACRAPTDRNPSHTPQRTRKALLKRGLLVLAVATGIGAVDMEANKDLR